MGLFSSKQEEKDVSGVDVKYTEKSSIDNKRKERKVCIDRIEKSSPVSRDKHITCSVKTDGGGSTTSKDDNKQVLEAIRPEIEESSDLEKRADAYSISHPEATSDLSAERSDDSAIICHGISEDTVQDHFDIPGNNDSDSDVIVYDAEKDRRDIFGDTDSDNDITIFDTLEDKRTSRGNILSDADVDDDLIVSDTLEDRSTNRGNTLEETYAYNDTNEYDATEDDPIIDPVTIDDATMIIHSDPMEEAVLSGDSDVITHNPWRNTETNYYSTFENKTSILVNPFVDNPNSGSGGTVEGSSRKRKRNTSTFYQDDRYEFDQDFAHEDNELVGKSKKKKKKKHKHKNKERHY